MTSSTTSRLQDDQQLEFQECALLVGAHVTLVGELHRNTGGDFKLVPGQQQQQQCRRPPNELWRTSWECSMVELDSKQPQQHGATSIKKIMVSDNPLLLQP